MHINILWLIAAKCNLHLTFDQRFSRCDLIKKIYVDYIILGVDGIKNIGGESEIFEASSIPAWFCFGHVALMPL